jgi:hypothetical protein
VRPSRFIAVGLVMVAMLFIGAGMIVAANVGIDVSIPHWVLT